jgi:hypothetical protein
VARFSARSKQWTVEPSLELQVHAQLRAQGEAVALGALAYHLTAVLSTQTTNERIRELETVFNVARR